MITNPDYFNLDRITALNRPHCKIKNRERVEKLLTELISGGADQLQVVTDFDYTLTKQKTENGKPILSSFGMFNKCKSLPDDYLRESKKLFKKYRPIEINPNIAHDDKVKYMIEWWTLSAQLLR